VWGWIAPLRALRRRRRRFASLCFLGAGVAFGTSVYLVLTRVERAFDAAHFPILAGLVVLMVMLFHLGASAEAEVAKLEQEIAELEAEAVRLLGQRS
jgi:hypothetical protein